MTTTARVYAILGLSATYIAWFCILIFGLADALSPKVQLFVYLTTYGAILTTGFFFYWKMFGSKTSEKSRNVMLIVFSSALFVFLALLLVIGLIFIQS